MLQKTGLSLVKFKRKQFTENLFDFGSVEISHHVHGSILLKERDIFTKQNSEVAFLFVELFQLVLLQEQVEFILVIRGSRLFGVGVEFTIFRAKFGSCDFLVRDLTSPSQLIA